MAQDGEQAERQDRGTIYYPPFLVKRLISSLDVTKMTIEELRESQVAMEDKVYRIWTVLSAFEGK